MKVFQRSDQSLLQGNYLHLIKGHWCFYFQVSTSAVKKSHHCFCWKSVLRWNEWNGITGLLLLNCASLSQTNLLQQAWKFYFSLFWVAGSPPELGSHTELHVAQRTQGFAADDIWDWDITKQPAMVLLQQLQHAARLYANTCMLLEKRGPCVWRGFGRQKLYTKDLGGKRAKLSSSLLRKKTCMGFGWVNRGWKSILQIRAAKGTQRFQRLPR